MKHSAPVPVCALLSVFPADPTSCPIHLRTAVPNYASTGATGHESPLMKADDAPPDVPPGSLNPKKDPDEWVTKDEAMTGPQRSYLQMLCREAREEFSENWTKAEASKKIEELQKRTGRGKSGTTGS